MANRVAAPQGAGVVLAYGGLSLLRCFRNARGPITLVESESDALTLHSKYPGRICMTACPRLEPDRALAGLLAIGRTLKERPMLAFDNEAVLLLASRNRESLAPYYRFVLADAELVEDLSCKLRFAALAERLGLPVPRSIKPGPLTTAEEVAEKVGVPCVLKPNSHGGRFKTAVEHEHGFLFKVLVANDLKELRAMYQRMPLYCDSFLVQQYIPGDDRSLYSFHAYLDAEARPLGCFIGRKIRTCPKGSGGSSYLELVHEPELMQLGLALMRQMKAVGPMKIDFKRDAQTGKWYILECNARFTLWNYLGAASGINLPMLALADQYGQAVTPVDTYRTNVRWLALEPDLNAFMRQYHPDGDWSWGRWLWSLRSRKVYETFAWRDAWPAVVNAKRIVRARVDRLLYRRAPAPLSMPTIAPAPSQGGSRKAG